MMDWRNEALCRDEDPELWFPLGDEGPGADQAGLAKAICRACPVREACLAWAVAELPFGIAGGLDERERAALRRDARISA